MQRTGKGFLDQEIRETQLAKPSARILSFEGRDLRDSIPVEPDNGGENERYDLICVESLAEKIRSGKARELVALLFSGLNPGGRLLVGSAAGDGDERLKAHNVEALAQLSASIPGCEIGGQTLWEQADGIVFFELYRKVA